MPRSARPRHAVISLQAIAGSPVAESAEKKHRERRRNHTPRRTPRTGPGGGASGENEFPVGRGTRPRHATPMRHRHAATMRRPVSHRNPRSGSFRQLPACAAGPGHAARTRSGSVRGGRPHQQLSSAGEPLSSWPHASIGWLQDHVPRRDATQECGWGRSRPIRDPQRGFCAAPLRTKARSP